ncbi:hypothetical protein A5881_000859 [Enterococcus termitis]
MKKQRFLISNVLILCTYLLLIFVNQYQRQQDKLFFESNDLYSTDHLFVKETFQTIVEDKFKASDDLSIFIPLESKNNDEVRGYFSKNYSEQHFPIKNGSFFSASNSKEALIGKDVATISENNCTYYQYNNDQYKVIGYLGLTNPSFLDNSVLINDSSLFSMPTTYLAIDGRKINTIYQDTFGKNDSYQKNMGLDRKVNSDYFSPLIYSLTLFIVIMSTVLIAYLIFTDLKRENCIKYILGTSTFTKYKSNLFYLLSTCIIPVIFCLLILPLFKIISIQYFFIFKFLFIHLLLMCFSFTCFFIKEERSNLHGVIL